MRSFLCVADCPREVLPLSHNAVHWLIHQKSRLYRLQFFCLFYLYLSPVSLQNVLKACMDIIASRRAFAATMHHAILPMVHVNAGMASKEVTVEQARRKEYQEIIIFTSSQFLYLQARLNFSFQYSPEANWTSCMAGYFLLLRIWIVWWTILGYTRVIRNVWWGRQANKINFELNLTQVLAKLNHLLTVTFSDVFWCGTSLWNCTDSLPWLAMFETNACTPCFPCISLVDVDECEQGSHSCSVHAKCSNTYGSYGCFCVTGYHGSGFSCQGTQLSPSGMLTCTNTVHFWVFAINFSLILNNCASKSCIQSSILQVQSS